MTPGRVEEDRYLVILSCGHWTQTRQPDDETFLCEHCGTEVKPAAADDGDGGYLPAILDMWTLHERSAT